MESWQRHRPQQRHGHQHGHGPQPPHRSRGDPVGPGPREAVAEVEDGEDRRNGDLDAGAYVPELRSTTWKPRHGDERLPDVRAPKGRDQMDGSHHQLDLCNAKELAASAHHSSVVGLPLRQPPGEPAHAEREEGGRAEAQALGRAVPQCEGRQAQAVAAVVQQTAERRGRARAPRLHAVQCVARLVEHREEKGSHLSPERQFLLQARCARPQQQARGDCRHASGHSKCIGSEPQGQLLRQGSPPDGVQHAVYRGNEPSLVLVRRQRLEACVTDASRPPAPLAQRARPPHRGLCMAVRSAAVSTAAHGPRRPGGQAFGVGGQG
mmetsp:Transcript_16252/g.50842  ORF Transcript_16252/g.50842 Transcript_16252/m.50842 type:complete len:322 (+) Transcript_16252:390-1355(+)